MDKIEIYVLVAVLVAVAVRLYKKYSQKDRVKSGTDLKTSSDFSFSSTTEDDHYDSYL